MRLLSILRSTINFKGFCFEDCFLSSGVIFIKIRPRKNSKCLCSICGCSGSTYDTRSERKWRHLSLWHIPVYFVYRPRRIHCHNCHKIVTESIPWSLGKCRLTRSLIIELARSARILSWKTVAEVYDVNWVQVRNAVHSAVQWGLEHRDTSNVKLLGIDEISQRKHHHYLTVVYELCPGQKRLLWIGEGRTKATLRSFFQHWGSKRCSQIEGVCCDMWDAYSSMVRKYLPNAVLVFDKFHIAKHLNEAVDKVRRKEISEHKNKGASELKGTRYIWLKNSNNLSEKQIFNIYDLEKANLKTHRAWLIKETFRHFWKCESAKEAELQFKIWFDRAVQSGLKPIEKIAWMIKEKLKNILTIFDMPINNGATEGLNNKAKSISHRSYGFRKSETMKIALMNAMGKLDLPPT